MKQGRIELPRGVIKIRKGYNPNSSSIGTVVYSFPIAYPVLCTVLAVLTALIAKVKKRS